MVNLHKDHILKEYPQVNAVLGSGAIDKILETITALEEQQDKSTQEKSNGPLLLGDEMSDLNHPGRCRHRSFLEQGDTPRFVATPLHYAYMKIAEGCKRQCSFCVIPQIKGRLQSQPTAQIV
jgi:ribosomal protein S12 methylthiotransferase